MSFILVFVLFTGMNKNCLPQQSETFMYEIIKNERYDSVMDQVILDENFDYERSMIFNNDLVLCHEENK